MTGIDYALVAPPTATARSLDVGLKVRGCAWEPQAG